MILYFIAPSFTLAMALDFHLSAFINVSIQTKLLGLFMSKICWELRAVNEFIPIFSLD